MHTYLAFIAILMLEALATGLAWQGSRRARLTDSEFYTHINVMMRKLEQSSRSGAILDLNEIYGPRFATLSDESLTLAHTFSYDSKALRTLYQNAEQCQFGANPPSHELAKEWRWQQAKCGKREALTEQDLRQEPYVDPFGHSYVVNAARLHLIDIASPQQGWLGYVPIAELSALKPTAFPFHYLAELDQTKRQALHNNHPVLLSDTMAAISESFIAPENGWGKRYRLVPRNVWDQIMASSELEVTTKGTRATCRKPIGDFCIEYSNKRHIYFHTAFQLLSATMFMTMTFGVSFVWWERRRKKREEYRIKQQTINLLTHELRTPITTMRLQLEAIRLRFDHLPNTVQDEFLGMCNTMQRLTRTLEASEHFVRSENGKHLALQTLTLIPLQPFLQDIMEPYNLDFAETVVGVENVLVRCHPSWLRIAVENLLRNALIHGVKPIQVLVEEKADMLCIHVIDQGSLTKNPLKRWTVSNRESQTGLGIGLDLTKELLQLMGGTLTCSLNPTTFTMRLTRHEL